MDAKDVGTLALIAGASAAAMVADVRRYVDGPQRRSDAGTKRYRKQRDKKRRTAKLAKKRNRR